MGLSLEFYAGDAALIGADFAEVEFDGLRDGTRAIAYADFSLHLAASDLDVLSKVVAEHLDVQPLLLSDCLIGTVGTIGEEGGADIVEPMWVSKVAALEDGDAPTVSARWFEYLRADYGHQLEVTTDAVEAVRTLIRLCRQAIQERADVVHAWYL
jgi:hypothetical protein